MNQNLDIELLKIIFGNLGALLISKENIIDKKLKFTNDDNTVDEYLIYGGELELKNYKALLSNIGNAGQPEFVAIFEVDSATKFGFKLAWNEEGLFLKKQDKKWVQISKLYKLNLASAFEIITQEGQLWKPLKQVEELHAELIDLLDFISSD